MVKKSRKDLQSQAAFGPKIGRGQIDPSSPGNRLAQFPVKHKEAMKSAMYTGMAFESGRGLMRTGLGTAERMRQIAAGAEERALGGLIGEFGRQLRKARANGKKPKPAPK